MYDGIPEPERLRAAQFVTAMSSVLYPAYPDPATSSGWAEVPAVMLLVDFAGREDIVYAAMINASSCWQTTSSWRSHRHQTAAPASTS